MENSTEETCADDLAAVSPCLTVDMYVGAMRSPDESVR